MNDVIQITLKALLLSICIFLFANEMRSQDVVSAKILSVDSVQLAEYGYFDFLIVVDKAKAHILVDKKLEEIDLKFLTKNIGKRVSLKLGKVMEFRLDDDTFLRHSRVKMDGIYLGENFFIDFSDKAEERYYSIIR